MFWKHLAVAMALAALPSTDTQATCTRLLLVQLGKRVGGRGGGAFKEVAGSWFFPSVSGYNVSANLPSGYSKVWLLYAHYTLSNRFSSRSITREKMGGRGVEFRNGG